MVLLEPSAIGLGTPVLKVYVRPGPPEPLTACTQSAHGKRVVRDPSRRNMCKHAGAPGYARRRPLALPPHQAISSHTYAA